MQFYQLQLEQKLCMDMTPEYWFAIFLQQVENNDNKHFLLTKSSFERMKQSICFSTLVQVQHQLILQLKHPFENILQKQKR